eukprot:comp24014_c0_seq1/m.42862 comp24014_c0_seq1/g.42862  ORF comp24014_c0_seq1/g.42862 comp24014_c0_seq1/m.42862 type:complete len:316 (+) comp24014_c0_seq1:1029-1976(+)
MHLLGRSQPLLPHLAAQLLPHLLGHHDMGLGHNCIVTELLVVPCCWAAGWPCCRRFLGRGCWGLGSALAGCRRRLGGCWGRLCRGLLGWGWLLGCWCCPGGGCGLCWGWGCRAPLWGLCLDLGLVAALLDPCSLDTVQLLKKHRHRFLPNNLHECSECIESSLSHLPCRVIQAQQQQLAQLLEQGLGQRLRAGGLECPGQEQQGLLLDRGVFVLEPPCKVLHHGPHSRGGVDGIQGLCQCSHHVGLLLLEPVDQHIHNQARIVCKVTAQPCGQVSDAVGRHHRHIDVDVPHKLLQCAHQLTIVPSRQLWGLSQLL